MDRSWTSYCRLLPKDMVTSPVDLETHLLDRFMHASDPDINDLVDNFSIQQVPDYGDAR